MPNQKTETASSTNEKPILTMAVNFGFAFIILCMVIYLLHAGAAITIPFVMSVFVWYLINALARKLARYGMTRFWSRLFAILILLAGVWFVSQIVSTNAAEVFRSASVYQKKFTTALPSLLQHIPEGFRPEPQDMAAILDVAGILKVLVQSFTGFAGKALVVLFYTGFLLYEQQFFARKIKELARTKAKEERVQKVIQNIDNQMQHYISVKTFVSMMAGFFTWALLLSYGMTYAGFWGVMVFFFTFIPYFGPLAAVVLPAIVGLVQLGETIAVVPFFVGLCMIQALWSGLVGQKLMGDMLNLSPIFILLSLAAWTMIWGVPGMFLAVPILATMVIILSQFSKTRPLAVLLSRTGEVQK